jgi:hypothetical protein
MIPDANKPYVRGSIMTLWVVIGVTLSGVARLVFPSVVSSSSALQALPAFVLILLNAAWILSGLVTVVGILRGRRDIEAAGLILIATSFGCFFLAILAFRPSTAPSVVYIPTFALGAAWRGYYVNHGAGQIYVGDADVSPR